MNLKKALDVHRGDALAFVGAGGKSSLLFALARELEPPVIVTTTTHLGLWQTDQVDRHVIVKGDHDLQQINFSHHQLVMITGLEDEDQRLPAPPPEVLEKIHRTCQREGVFLLIEADGARQRNLKAPAVYEPVIPRWVDKVVVVAGLQGLEKSLSAGFVHRPELFASLSGLPVGGRIGVSEIVSVLASRSGGLKGLPGSAYRILFLNQADTPALGAAAHRAAESLVAHYQRVLIGSVLQPEKKNVLQSVHSRVAGIILAAGGSERLGSPKQLLEWEGKAFIHKVVKNALEASLTPLVVVAGAEHEAVREELDGVPIELVYAPDWAQGQAASMKAGLRALPQECEGVMFLLCDQPQVSLVMIRQILERFAQNRSAITAPLIRGQRGNPVLFSGEAFSSLHQVVGDRGGRAVFDQFQVDWLPWVDDRASLDVDQERDYRTLKSAYFLGSEETHQ